MFIGIIWDYLGLFMVELWWFVSSFRSTERNYRQGRCWKMCFYLFWTSNICAKYLLIFMETSLKKKDSFINFHWRNRGLDIEHTSNIWKTCGLEQSDLGHATFSKSWFYGTDSAHQSLGKAGLIWFLIGQVEFLGHQPPKLWCTAQLTPYPIILISPPLVPNSLPSAAPLCVACVANRRYPGFLHYGSKVGPINIPLLFYTPSL